MVPLKKVDFGSFCLVLLTDKSSEFDFLDQTWAVSIENEPRNRANIWYPQNHFVWRTTKTTAKYSLFGHVVSNSSSILRRPLGKIVFYCFPYFVGLILRGKRPWFTYFSDDVQWVLVHIDSLEGQRIVVGASKIAISHVCQDYETVSILQHAVCIANDLT